MRPEGVPDVEENAVVDDGGRFLGTIDTLQAVHGVLMNPGSILRLAFREIQQENARVRTVRSQPRETETVPVAGVKSICLLDSPAEYSLGMGVVGETEPDDSSAGRPPPSHRTGLGPRFFEGR